MVQGDVKNSGKEFFGNTVIRLPLQNTKIDLQVRKKLQKLEITIITPRKLFKRQEKLLLNHEQTLDLAATVVDKFSELELLRVENPEEREQ
jgi:hypothetical protein